MARRERGKLDPPDGEKRVGTNEDGVGVAAWRLATRAQQRPMAVMALSVTLDDLPAEFRRQWLAPDGTARVQVLSAAEVTDGEKMQAFAVRIQTVAQTATGLPILISEAAKIVRESFAQAVVITAIAIILIIVVVRRRLSDVILILTPLVLASIWTVAGAAVLGLAFNFANVIVIPVSARGRRRKRHPCRLPCPRNNRDGHGREARISRKQHAAGGPVDGC